MEESERAAQDAVEAARKNSEEAVARAEEINRQSQEVAEESAKKVQEAAELKALRHRVDEYMAMIIALTAVLILWLLQYLGLY